MALLETGITYKRTTKSRTVIDKELPNDWTEAEVVHYGRSKTQSLPCDVEVRCYYRGRISVIFKNGGVV